MTAGTRKYLNSEHEYGDAKVTEASLNGLPPAQIAERFQEDPYRFLVCADNSRPATMSRCCTPCTWTRRCPASRRCRPCRASTGRTLRSTTCSCSTFSTTPTELFKQFMDNDSFKRWMTDTVFSLAYEPAGTS